MFFQVSGRIFQKEEKIWHATVSDGERGHPCAVTRGIGCFRHPLMTAPVMAEAKWRRLLPSLNEAACRSGDKTTD
jgi:hypothetical protein